MDALAWTKVHFYLDLCFQRSFSVAYSVARQRRCTDGMWTHAGVPSLVHPLMHRYPTLDVSMVYAVERQPFGPWVKPTLDHSEQVRLCAAKGSVPCSPVIWICIKILAKRSLDAEQRVVFLSAG